MTITMAHQPATQNITTDARATRANHRKLRGLADAARLFFANGNAWILCAAVVITATARAQIGSFTGWDLLLAGLLVALQPFQEWLIHVHILHWQPKSVLGIWVDPELCRKHRDHHRDPWHLDDVFIPRRSLLALIPLHVGLWWVIAPSKALMATGLLVTFTIGLLYEWTHFLIHTTYKPRSRLYKRLFRYHRLHHFKNEKYWFGVTMHTGDHLMRTMPTPRKVPTSPTARDIGGLQAAALETSAIPANQTGSSN